MKRVFVSFILALLVIPAFSQDALEGAMISQYKKDKEKSDAKIQDPKAAEKASTWMDRAKLYENIALVRDTTQVIDADAASKALEAYKKVAELDKTKKGEPGKLAKEAQAIVDGEKQSPLYDAFINQGVKAFQGKNLQGALDNFSAAHGIFKSDTTGALYAAISAQQLNNHDVAIQNYAGYAKNGGKDPSAFYGYAQLYREKKDYDNALQALDMGLKANANHKDLMSEKVNILLAAGREEAAIKELTGLVEKDPNNVVNLTNLGILYDNTYSNHTKNLRELEEKLAASGGQKGKLAEELQTEKSKIEVYDGEIKRLAARVKAQPKNAELKRQLQEVNNSKKETETAIAKIEGDLKAAEEKEKAVNKSEIEGQINDLKAKQAEAKNNALKTYEKAIAVDEKNYDALFGLGAIYYNEGVELKREVDNMNMQEYQQKGKEVEGKVCGRFKKSRPYFERAAAVNPDSDAKTTLDNINNIIQQVESKNIPCAE
ncbi:tetratricopeptide repeat protein [Ravibacter arvi]